VLGAGRDPAALVDALLAEARLHAPPAPSTVYLGGGTPTFLPPGELSRLLDGLDKQTGFRSSASEVSAECNPESLSQETAAALVAGGVTRLSLGIQSLRDETLTFLGRPHNRDQALAAYDIARAAQPRSLGLDLIYAVPGLSTEAWRADLATALGLGPDHLSAYALTWEEGTALRSRQGQPGHHPASETVELEQFWLTRELAWEAGLDAYEVSNFARSGHECAHNVNYWRNGAYIGLGPSAVSRWKTRRWGNQRDLQAWSSALAAERPTPPAWEEELAPRARLGESWWLGLRLASGVCPAALRESVGLSEAEDTCLPKARALLDQGLLEEVPPAELPPAELPPAELPPAELPPAELPPAELPPAELPPAELPPAELPPVELPPVELPPVELPPAELPPAELPPVELPPVELPPAELPPGQPQPTELPPAALPPLDPPPRLRLSRRGLPLADAIGREFLELPSATDS
jgi:oxygen-independent coproporphyrinogen-3 oxidase